MKAKRAIDRFVHVGSLAVRKKYCCMSHENHRQKESNNVEPQAISPLLQCCSATVTYYSRRFPSLMQGSECVLTLDRFDDCALIILLGYDAKILASVQQEPWTQLGASRENYH